MNSRDKSQGLGEKVLRGATFLSLQVVIGLVSSFGTLIILLRYFGPHQYGLYVLAVSFVGIFGVLTGNTQEALKRYIPEFLVKNDTHSVRQVLIISYGVKLLLSIVLTMCFVILNVKIAYYYNENAAKELGPLLRIGALSFLSTALTSNGSALFLGMQKYSALAKIALLTGIVNFIIALLAAILSLTLLQFYATSVCVSILIGVMISFYGLNEISKEMRKIESSSSVGDLSKQHSSYWPLLKRIGTYCGPLWGASANYTVHLHVTRIILGYWVSPQAVAYFSVAKTGLERLTDLYNQIPNVLLPTMSEQLGMGRKESVDRAILIISRWVCVLAVVLCVGVVLFSRELVLFIGGIQYQESVALTQILAIQFIFRLPASIFGILYYCYEKTIYTFLFNVIRVVPMVIMLYYFIPKFYLTGAAAIEAFSYVISILLIAWHAPKVFNIKPEDISGPFLKSVLLIVLLMPLSYLVLSIKPYWLLLIAKLLILAFIPITCFAINLLSSADIEYLKGLGFRNSRLKRLQIYMAIYLETASRLGKAVILRG